MVYIFDVDGTLTPSRQVADDEMIEFLLKWGSENKFYLCSGSDIEKIQEQLPSGVLDLARGVFCCMGNSFYRNCQEVYRRDFKPPSGLEDDLLRFLRNSTYPDRYGNHIEKRIGMWNFSVIGRNVPNEKRSHYLEWDDNHRERESIAKFINNKYSNTVCATVGGEISIDINNFGADKSQVLSEIRELESCDSHITFIGDRTYEGGNDYALAVAVEEYGLGKVFQTESWQHTRDILISLS